MEIEYYPKTLKMLDEIERKDLEKEPERRLLECPKCHLPAAGLFKYDMPLVLKITGSCFYFCTRCGHKFSK